MKGVTTQGLVLGRTNINTVQVDGYRQQYIEDMTYYDSSHREQEAFLSSPHYVYVHLSVVGRSLNTQSNYGLVLGKSL